MADIVVTAGLENAGDRGAFELGYHDESRIRRTRRPHRLRQNPGTPASRCTPSEFRAIANIVYCPTVKMRSISCSRS